MRRALVPRSPRPSREAERTSTRLADAERRDADHDVVPEAEERRGGGRLDAQRRGVGGDDLPAQPARRLEAALERDRRVRAERERQDVGIGAALQRGDRLAAVGEAVGRRAPQRPRARRTAAGTPVSVLMSWIGGRLRAWPSIAHGRPKAAPPAAMPSSAPSSAPSARRRTAHAAAARQAERAREPRPGRAAQQREAEAVVPQAEAVAQARGERGERRQQGEGEGEGGSLRIID